MILIIAHYLTIIKIIYSSHMLNDMINLIKPSNQRRIKIKQLDNIIKELNQYDQDLSLGQKYSYLVMLTKMFLSFHRNFHTRILRMNKNAFSSSSNEQTKKKSYARTTQKKVRIDHGKPQGINEVTINDISNTFLQSNKRMMSLRSVEPLFTIKQEPVFQQANQITIPPFSPEMIARISQDLQKSFKEQSFLGSEFKFKQVWDPQLFKYQKWLPVTQQDVNKTVPKIRKSGEKGTKTTVNKKNKQIKDQILDEPQDILDFSANIQKLATKVKEFQDKQIYNQNFDKTRLVFCLDLLKDHQFLVTKVQGDTQRINRTKYHNTKLKSQSNSQCSFDQRMQTFAMDEYRSEFKSSPKDFYLIQENDASLTARLQTIICQEIGNEHLFNESISFKSFCSTRTISKEIKGQLFYQLLHLPYNLVQENAANFGDIHILKN